MGYIHKGCKGDIRWFPPLPIPPRCKKCGKTWSPLVVYSPVPPKDMVFIRPRPKAILIEGQTSYNKKLAILPGVDFIASHLPAWPRWARILSFVLFTGVLSFIAYWFLGK